jgi:hypothetical protein
MRCQYRRDVVGRLDVAEAEPLSGAGQPAAGQIGKELGLALLEPLTSASRERFCAVDGGTDAQSFLGDEEVEGVAATPQAKQRNRCLSKSSDADGRVSPWNGHRTFCRPER